MTKVFPILVAAAFSLCATPAPAEEAIDGATLFAEGCAQCHGRTGRGSGAFPTLRGKSLSYLTSRLEKYRAAERVGPNSMLMYPVAEGLTDADIGALAMHISENYR
jgi:cytochrome c553